MDYNLYITLSEKDLETIGIFEVMASWGEKIFSYEPRRFVFEDKVEMIFLECKMMIETKEYVKERKVMLKIISGLRELEWEINKQRENLKSNSIIKMLQKICQLDEFSIYIFKDDEIIERQIEYTNGKDIILLIDKALNWESLQNIKIFCKR